MAYPDLSIVANGGTTGQVPIQQASGIPLFKTVGGGGVLSANGDLVISRELAKLGGSTVLGTSLPMWATTGASGSLTTLVVVPVWLDAGCTVTHIEFCSSAAANTPTHYWFALFSPAMALLAQTADQTTTAWGAATKKSLALASSQAISTADNYGVGFYMEATASCSLLRFSPLINATLPDTTIAGYYGTGYGATAPASPARTASQTHWWWCQVKGTIP